MTRASGPTPHGIRALQVVLSLHPGGTERLVVELASRLHAEIPMAVCCLDEAGEWAEELREHEVDVTVLGRQPGFRPGLGAGIAAAARRHGATLLHAHHYTPFVYSCVARARHPGLRLVFTEHGRLTDAAPSPRRRAANLVLSRVPHGVFTVSRDLKRHLVAEGFPARRVDVIYNGIDVGPPPDRAARAGVRATLEVAEDRIVVGTIARLDPVKDLGTAISAVAHLGAPYELWIIGDGPERVTLERRAASLGAQRVRFLGQRGDARRLLAGCDLYVNCSVSEGISLTILEAMAAALPVVATDVGGTPEILDSASGRLVPARDAQALAGTLRELGGSPSLRRRLGDAARRRVLDAFRLEMMIDRYRDVYATVTASGGH